MMTLTYCAMLPDCIFQKKTQDFANVYQLKVN